MFGIRKTIEDPNLPVFSAGVEKFCRMIDAFNDAYPNQPVGVLTAFLHIARSLRELNKGEINMRSIADDLQIPYATFLRHTDILADGIAKTKHTEGLHLIEKTLHPADKRSRVAILTANGQAMMDKFEEILQE